MNQLKGFTNIKTNLNAEVSPLTPLVGDASVSKELNISGSVNPTINITGLIKDGTNYGTILLNVKHEDNKTIIWLTLNGEKIEPEIIISDNYISSIDLKEDEKGLYLLSSLKDGTKLKTRLKFSADKIEYTNEYLNSTTVEEGLNRLSLMTKAAEERLSLVEKSYLNKNLSILPKGSPTYDNKDSLIYVYQNGTPTYLDAQQFLTKIIRTSDVNPSELQQYEYEFKKI